MRVRRNCQPQRKLPAPTWSTALTLSCGRADSPVLRRANRAGFLSGGAPIHSRTSTRPPGEALQGTVASGRRADRSAVSCLGIGSDGAPPGRGYALGDHGKLRRFRTPSLPQCGRIPPIPPPYLGSRYTQSILRRQPAGRPAEAVVHRKMPRFWSRVAPPLQGRSACGWSFFPAPSFESRTFRKHDSISRVHRTRRHAPALLAHPFAGASSKRPPLLPRAERSYSKRPPLGTALYGKTRISTSSTSSTSGE